MGTTYRTSGRQREPTVTWNETKVTLLGTRDFAHVVEYLRGPPTIIEVHDRDRRATPPPSRSVFGNERDDLVIGTQTYCKGMGRREEGDPDLLQRYGEEGGRGPRPTAKVWGGGRGVVTRTQFHCKDNGRREGGEWLLGPSSTARVSAVYKHCKSHADHMMMSYPISKDKSFFRNAVGCCELLN